MRTVCTCNRSPQPYISSGNLSHRNHSTQWQVHRLLRPEAYGGLVHNSLTSDVKTPLPDSILRNTVSGLQLISCPFVLLACALSVRNGIHCNRGPIAGLCVDADSNPRYPSQTTTESVEKRCSTSTGYLYIPSTNYCLKCSIWINYAQHVPTSLTQCPVHLLRAIEACFGI